MVVRCVLIVTAYLLLATIAWADDKGRDNRKSDETRISQAEQFLTAGEFDKVGPLLADRSDDRQSWENILPKLYSDMAVQASDLPQGRANKLSLALRNFFEARDKKEEQSLTSCKELDSFLSKHLGEEHAFRSFIRIEIGETLVTQGRYSQAALLLSKNVERLKKMYGEENPFVARSLELIGLCCTHRGQYRRAELSLRKAISLFHATVGSEHKSAVQCTNHLVYLLTRIGKYQEATRLARKVLKFAEANYPKSSPELVKSYLFLGGSLQGEGKLSKAETFLNQAYRLAVEQQKDSVLVGSCLAHQGICLRLQGRHRASEAAFQHAYQIYLEVHGETNRNTAVCLWNLAQIQVVRKKYSEAIPNIKRLIAIQDKLKREANHDQALGARRLLIQCRRRQGIEANGEQYAKLLKESIESARKSWGPESVQAVSASAKLARFYDEIGQQQKSIELLQEGLASCRKTFGKYHANTIGLQRELGHLYFRLGQLDQAQRFLTIAADSYEANRETRGAIGLQNASQSNANQHLPLLAIILAKNDEFEKAWQRLEQSNSRALFDDLANRSLQRDAPKDYENRIAISKRLNAIDRNLTAAAYSAKRVDPRILSQIRDQYEHTVLSLRTFDEKVTNRFGAQVGGVFNLDRVQAQIPDDTAIVTWISLRWQRGDQAETWACVVKAKGEPKWLQLNPTSQKLRNSESYQTLANVSRQLDKHSLDSFSNFNEDVKSASKAFFAPVEKLLNETDSGERIRNLIVTFPIPFNIPLEVLSDKFRVSYSPSATIFAWLKENSSDLDETSSEPALLAVADPTFSANDDNSSFATDQRSRAKTPYQPLPGTRAEVQALAELFDDKSRILAGNEASEFHLQQLVAADQLKDYAFIHLATHGEPNATQPFQSSLILADDGRSQTVDETIDASYVLDSRLTAQEMLNNWRLEAELVTLSACETIRGKFVPGEYYLGFSQALLFAGTRSVVVSMWPVRDDATSLLMQRFYANMLGKTAGLKAPLGKASALREAKRWLRELTANDLDELMVNLTPALRSRVRSHRKATVKKTVRPFEHPYFWAPFILIGAPD